MIVSTCNESSAQVARLGQSSKIEQTNHVSQYSDDVNKLSAWEMPELEEQEAGFELC